jgi:hypothetical protein
MINIDPKYKYQGIIPLADILPPLERDLTKAIISHDEQAESMLVWLANAVYYMTGDSDELPRIDLKVEIN